jgi:hypothetical protein
MRCRVSHAISHTGSGDVSARLAAAFVDNSLEPVHRLPALEDLPDDEPKQLCLECSARVTLFARSFHTGLEGLRGGRFEDGHAPTISPKDGPSRVGRPRRRPASAAYSRPLSKAFHRHSFI